jgi:hypothetical protein
MRQFLGQKTGPAGKPFGLDAASSGGRISLVNQDRSLVRLLWLRMTMFKLSKLTDYAVVVLVRLARADGRADLARALPHAIVHPGADGRQGAEEHWPARGWCRRSAARGAAIAWRGRLASYPGGRCDRGDRWADRADGLRG